MDRYITHTAHLVPWNLGMLFNKIGRSALNLVHGLTNDLDIALIRALGQDANLLRDLPLARRSTESAADPQIHRFLTASGR